MSQSFNSDAFRATFSVLFKDCTPAIPHFQVKTIADISPKYLWEQGIRAVIFDKDNTITAPYVNEIYPTLQDVVLKFQHIFGDSMKILSNSAGTNDDKDFKDAEQIEKQLGISVIRHSQKKPLGIEAVLKQFSCNPEEIMMIGDRLLTDVLFGNYAGMLTVHTEILTTKNDNKPAMAARKFENSKLKKWRARGMKAPSHKFDSIQLQRS